MIKYLFALFVLIVAASLHFSFKPKNKIGPVNIKGMAVVELFTSEGCSSCPPADEAVINLQKEFPEIFLYWVFMLSTGIALAGKMNSAMLCIQKGNNSMGSIFHSAVFTHHKSW